MPEEIPPIQRRWERGVVVLSIDTEQRWGYLDLLNDAQYAQQYPNAPAIHERILAALGAASLSATWFVVGGLSLRSSRGPHDPRMAGLPASWTAAIPAGTESTAPLWYRPAFVEKLRTAQPSQEIGLHGGLTHFLWTGPQATRAVLEWELAEGIKALEQAGARPLAFSFGREREAHYDLLPLYGIRCYRGRTASFAHRLGSSVPGKLLRAANEVSRATPPVVWPQETLPGLWNIPASLFLYPLRASRSRWIGVKSRIQRFLRGIEAAARYRGIFHYCLHPENLAESANGCSLFDGMLDALQRARALGDIEIMTLSEIAARIGQDSCPAKSSSNITVSRVGVSAASEPAAAYDQTERKKRHWNESKEQSPYS